MLAFGGGQCGRHAPYLNTKGQPFLEHHRHLLFPLDCSHCSFGDRPKHSWLPKQGTMPPFPALLANASSPNFHIPHASQPTVISLSNFNQSQWGPDSIGTIVFGFAMFFMGVVALWQGRARRLGCEQGTARLAPLKRGTGAR